MLSVVGPTASGKTGLAIKLAKQFDGEVISADSRQVYRGLDIGTAKVTPEETKGIPHHLIDVVDVDTIYTAHDFYNNASATIADIQARHKLPIIAGGTFFYLALLEGSMTAAPVAPNPELRQHLETMETGELLTLLQSKSPTRAHNIDPHNRRRIVRALEISEALGDVPPPIETVDTPYDFFHIALKTDKNTLRERFKERATSWVQGGFIEEVRSLLEKGVTRARLQEIGFEYTLGLDLLDAAISKDEFVEKFVQKNWQYAKRQYTWLKKKPNLHWYQPQDSQAIYADVATFLERD